MKYNKSENLLCDSNKSNRCNLKFQRNNISYNWVAESIPPVLALSLMTTRGDWYNQ